MTAFSQKYDPAVLFSAGLTSPHSGRVEGAFQLQTVWQGGVEAHIEDSLLKWRPTGGEPADFLAASSEVPLDSHRVEMPAKDADREMLLSFIRIAYDAESAVSFIEKWEPLELCAVHGKPSSHAWGSHVVCAIATTSIIDHQPIEPAKLTQQGRLSGADIDRLLTEAETEEPEQYWTERLEDYVHLAQVADAILTGAIALTRSEVDITESVFVALGNADPLPIKDRQRRDRLRLLLQQRVNLWIEQAGLSFALKWDGKDPSVVFTGGGTFARLGMQLLFAVGNSDGLAMCNRCSEPFFTSRKPQAGRNSYCKNCGRRAAVRDAQRRVRAKKALVKPEDSTSKEPKKTQRTHKSAPTTK